MGQYPSSQDESNTFGFHRKSQGAEQKAALVIGDQDGKAQRLDDLFQTVGVRTRALYGSPASPERLRAYLLNGKVDWLIIAPIHCSDTGKTLTFPNGRSMLMTNLIHDLPKSPEFVAILACNTWYLGQHFNRHNERSLALVTGTALSPSDSYWPFARLYLESALQGLPAGVALDHARKRFQSAYPGDHTPWQFGLIGDSNFQMIQKPVNPQEGIHQPDIYALYESGSHLLVNRIGKDHPRYLETLVYQQQLVECIMQSRQYGDSGTLLAKRAEVIARLNELALSALGVSFNELCGSIISTARQETAERLYPERPWQMGQMGSLRQNAFKTFDIVEQPRLRIEPYTKPTLARLTNADAYQRAIDVADYTGDSPVENNPATADRSEQKSGQEVSLPSIEKHVFFDLNQALKEELIEESADEPRSGESVDTTLGEFIFIPPDLYNRVEGLRGNPMISRLVSLLDGGKPMETLPSSAEDDPGDDLYDGIDLSYLSEEHRYAELSYISQGASPQVARGEPDKMLQSLARQVVQLVKKIVYELLIFPYH